MTTSLTENLEEDAGIINAVQLEGISKKYPLAKTAYKDTFPHLKDFWALRDISLKIPQGEVVGIIGRNGAGKTTLLNIIAGTLSPTHGKILVNGKARGLFNLGVGFQDELTGRENIFLNGTIIGATNKEVEGKFQAIIDFSELGEFINMPLGTYSQGMRLRLAFSVVVNLDFDILLVDEVLAVGDVVFQYKCYERLMDFRRAGKTLIITTQGMELIERLCDKTILLDHGFLLYEGNAAEGVKRYRSLLNTEKFFVGPAKKEMVLVEATKRWADDTSTWGRVLGTKEAVIEKVEFLNRFGWAVQEIKSGELLKIKVHFKARDKIKYPHFGIAIFRKDGIYCYGPNTLFDGCEIVQLDEGEGFFSLLYHRLLLAPGEYRVSIAIWDKHETLAYNYHEGYYALKVKGGQNTGNEFLDIPVKFYPENRIFFPGRNVPHPDLSLLGDKWGQKLDTGSIRIESVKFLDDQAAEKNAFMTNAYVKVAINFSALAGSGNDSYLWIGIYRDDAVYCQGITRPLGGAKAFSIVFPNLSLLPGGYRVSLGIWDKDENKFLMFHHGTYAFKMVFDRQDHGTVYLEHEWDWRQ